LKPEVEPIDYDLSFISNSQHNGNQQMGFDQEPELRYRKWKPEVSNPSLRCGKKDDRQFHFLNDANRLENFLKNSRQKRTPEVLDMNLNSSGATGRQQK